MDPLQQLMGIEGSIREAMEMQEDARQHFRNMYEFGKRINPKAWDAWEADGPLSSNIDDRRSEPPIGGGVFSSMPFSDYTKRFGSLGALLFHK